MEWIKCSDRMPGSHDEMYDHDYMYIYSSTKKLWGIGQWYFDKWIIFNDSGVQRCCIELELESFDITHWMPLPGDPDEQKLKDKELIPRIICDCWKHNCKHEKTCGIAVVFQEEK